MLEFIKEIAPAVLDALPHPIHVIKNGMTIWRNKASKELFPEKTSGPYCHQVIIGKEEPCHDCIVMEVFETGMETEKTQKHEGKVLRIDVIPVFDKLGSVVAVTESIIDKTGEAIKQSKIEKAKEKSEKESVTDELTQVYNYRGIIDLIDQEVERVKRYEEIFSVIMIDIDHFKEINDQFGHPTGNTVLAEIAEIFKKRIRTVDRVARYGGDEFIILLPKTDTKGALKVAESMREKIENHTFAEGALVKITISAGVAQFNSDSDREKVLKIIDEALFSSKEKGRNRVTVVKDNKNR